MLLSLSRVTAGCGHSEYENMESDVPDLSTDDEGLNNIRVEGQEMKSEAMGGRRSDGWKEGRYESHSLGRGPSKGAEHPTDDEDDIRSFEEEERRMAQELQAAEMAEATKSSVTQVIFLIVQMLFSQNVLR